DETIGDEADLPTTPVALTGVNGGGLIATILPLARSVAAMAAIFVQDPIVMPTLPGQAFAELYGLTRSELRVLIAMVPGLSVKEAAEVLGIGEDTGKTRPATHSLKDWHLEADRTHPFFHECHTASKLPAPAMSL